MGVKTVTPQSQATIETRPNQPVQFLHILLGTPSDAEVEERYLNFARVLLMGDTEYRKTA